MAEAKIAIIKIDKIKPNISNDVLSRAMAVIATMLSNDIDKSAIVIVTNAFLKLVIFKYKKYKLKLLMRS